MEFPELGENCALPTCRTLDFLPVRCSGCRKVFCKDHYCYDCHSCPAIGSLERQVPICPLCGVPVPTGPHESADIKVGQHIDTACKSKPALALKGKIFVNTCSVPRCKKKELVPFRCERCHLNFCVSHRNEMDHNCQGPQANSGGRRMSAAGIAAIKRALWNKPPNNNSAAVAVNGPPRMSEATTDRALQEEEDRQLALALAASLAAEEAEAAARRRRSAQQQLASSSEQNHCALS
ncbi:hypothetical protein AAHC03_05024 [Spirometra sp. Aus1]